MAYTTSGSVSYDVAVYDRLVRKPLRNSLFFDPWAEVKPTPSIGRGSSVTFWQSNDLALATTPLTEDVDVTPVAMSNTSVTVTPLEYGNATVTTARLVATSSVEIDPIKADVIGYNAGASINSLAAAVWAAGTNVLYAAGDDTASPPAARADLDYGASGSRHILRGVDVRKVRARLKAANVMPFADGLYMAMIHPDVTFDLQSETDLGGWLAPEVYSNRTGGVATGEIGKFAGFRFLEDASAPVFTDGGVGNVDAYRTLFWGREAVAKAHWNAGGYGEQPRVVAARSTDLLERFSPLGWKHAVAYQVFRQAALWAVESSSSIGTNA